MFLSAVGVWIAMSSVLLAMVDALNIRRTAGGHNDRTGSELSSASASPSGGGAGWGCQIDDGHGALLSCCGGLPIPPVARAGQDHAEPDHHQERDEQRIARVD